MDSILDNHYAIDISNNYPLIDGMYTFMSIHPDFYTINIEKKIQLHKGKSYDVFSHPVPFIDKVNCVTGFITTSFDESSDILQMHVIVDKLKFGHTCYVKTIKKYVDHYSEFGDTVTLKYYKILPKRLVKYNFYDEPLDKWPSDVKDLKETFFSPHKEYLFDVTKPNETHFKHAWNNIILYGPPGTGKSSFVHRMAIQRKMTIISLNLALYLDKKTELYALFHGEPFALPDSSIKHDINSNYIIILDEFDSAINILLSIEKIHECRKSITDEYFELQGNSVKSLIDSSTHNLTIEKDQKGSRRSNDFHENGSFNTNEFMMNALAEDRRSETLNTRSKIMDDTQKKMQFDTNINMINSNITSLIKSINEENKSDMLRMSDLLELFQGAVPIKKRMIIATTNNFEHIKNIIPALFRPGRLTPLKFDHLNWASFCDLCNYHYKEIPTDPFVIKIPTSQLVELVAKHNLFSSFIAEIKEMSTC